MRLMFNTVDLEADWDKYDESYPIQRGHSTNILLSDLNDSSSQPMTLSCSFNCNILKTTCASFSKSYSFCISLKISQPLSLSLHLSLSDKMCVLCYDSYDSNIRIGNNFL